MADVDSKPFVVDGCHYVDSCIAHMAENVGRIRSSTGRPSDGLICTGLVLAWSLLLLSSSAIQTEYGIFDLCADIGCIYDLAILSAPLVPSIPNDSRMANYPRRRFRFGTDGTLFYIDY